MNHHTSTNNSSLRSRASLNDISRKAYELWESEGRPEGCDLRHWLQAEQELNADQLGNEIKPEPAASVVDVRPLQNTRPAANPTRDTRRGSNAPFSGEKSVGNGNNPAAARRKPASAPAL